MALLNHHLNHINKVNYSLFKLLSYLNIYFQLNENVDYINNVNFDCQSSSNN